MAGGDVRAGGAYVEFSARGQQIVQNAVKSIQGAMDSLARKTALIGASLAAAGAAVTGPMLIGLNVGAEWARELTAGARRTGIEFSQLGSLSYALNTDIESLGDGVTRMNRFMMQAAEGTGDANRRLAQLGLTFGELNSLSQDQRLVLLMDRLNSRITDAGERARIMQEIFRNTRFNISGGAAGIASRQQHGHEIGADMTDAQHQTFALYNAATRDMEVSQRGLWTSIGAAAAPAMTELIVIVTKVIQSVRRWTEDNQPLLDIIFRVADKVVLFGGALIGLSGIIVGASYAMGFLGMAAGVVFGVFKFLTASAVLSAGATLIYSASVWALTVAWGALKATLLFVATGFGAATVGAFLAKIAMWAYTAATGPATLGTTILTGGLNLLIGAVTVLAGALAVVGLILPILGGGILLVAIGAFTYAVLEASGSLSAIGRSSVNAGSTIVGALSDAASRTRTSFMTMFTGIVQDAGTAWGGISAALSAGKWELLWEIVKVAAELAWIRIKAFAIDAWDAWKFAAVSTWNAITDGFSDAWRDSWAGLRALFAQGMAWIEAGWWRLSGKIVAALTDGPMETVRTILTAMASFGGVAGTGAALALAGLNSAPSIDFEGRAQTAETQGGTQARQIEGERAFAAAASDVERIVRDMEREATLQEEADARAAGNADAIGDAQFRLAELSTEAIVAAMDDEEARRRRIEQMTNDANNGYSAATEMVQGSFSANAVGYFSNGQTQGERLQEEANRIAADILDAIRNIPPLRMG